MSNLACVACGAELTRVARNGGVAGPYRYCSEACRPACIVRGCAGRPTPKTAKGYCQSHYARYLRTGSPEPHQFANELLCDVEGCGQPRRKRSWCASHYSQWKRKGEVQPFAYKWAAEDHPCESCGGLVPPEHSERRFCSSRCRWRATRAGGPPAMSAPRRESRKRPALAACGQCHESIDLTALHPNGRLKRVDVRLCDACRRAKQHRHKTSVNELARRDGTACGICSEQVDMTLRYPDLFRASVDHVIPTARGGSDDPKNLQLAHLWCNLVKSDREDFVI